MRTASIFLTILAVCGVFWYIVATLRIFEYLRRHSQKVSFIWLRVLAPWYAFRYRELTRVETGRVGSLYYQWIISINSALVFGLLAVIVRLL